MAKVLKTREEKAKGLGWKDYIALFIAMLTTTLLPILILIVILIAALVVLLSLVHI